MKIRARLEILCGWTNLSIATLVTLLQRTPVIRIAAAADEIITASPIGTILKSAVVGVGSLGVIDSMAGATLLATTVTQSPSGTLPDFNATVGVQITPLGFTITNSINIASWTIVGDLPPGLHLTTLESLGITLTGSGNLDATTPGTPSSIYSSGSSGNNTTTPILEGTPTTAGTYTFTLQGFAEANEKGGAGIAGFIGTGISSVFPFTIVVASATPAPTPTPTPPPTSTATSVPVFVTQPISVTVTGGTVALSAQASNSPTYQWMLNGTTPVQGATGPVLEFSDATSAVGSYTCVASNTAGSATSNPATISITSTSDIGRLINLSCRAPVGTGGNILITGFVVGGAGTTGAESVLVRGSGPALDAFAVAGTLPDPQLQIYSGNTLTGSNDGWAGNSSIALAASSVGAFAWTDPTSHDSALVENLQGGPYTAQISGQSGDTGVALAEVYDETPAADYTLASPRLINISARVQVGSGSNILIAGFVIGGSTSRTVLIRASGPALVPFGVSGTLPDPQLGLYSGSTLLGSNSAWGGNTDIANAAAAVGAFGWSSTSSNDSAILVTLPPGAYTAQVSGASGDTGVALVEVYEVP
jgi:hypothetical protein